MKRANIIRMTVLLILSIIIPTACKKTISGNDKKEPAEIKWQSIYPELNDQWIRSIAINNKGTVFIGADSGLYRVIEKFEKVNNGIVHSIAINSDGDIYASFNADIFCSTNNGYSWELVLEKSRTRSVTTIFISSQDEIFIGVNVLILYSDDKGNNWSEKRDGVMMAYSVFSFTEDKDGQIFVGTDSFGVYRLGENNKWVEFNSGVMFDLGDIDSTINVLMTHSSGDLFWGGRRLLRMKNGSNHWEELTSLEAEEIHSMAENSAGHLFAGTDQGVFRSIDNGEIWEKISEGLPDNKKIYSLAIDSNGFIYAGTKIGMYRSDKSSIK